MRRELRSVVIAALAIVCLVATRPARGASLLFIDSQPGDFQGSGRHVRHTDADADFYANSATPKFVAISIIGRTDASGFTDTWSTWFGVPLGQTLVPGVYENAAEFGDATQPFISVGAQVVCSGVIGRFTVLDIAFEPTGPLARFAADFEERCGPDQPPLVGSIRFHAGDGDCAGASDGTPCDDADACTASAECRGGACVGVDPVDCGAAPDQCHDRGPCDPLHGFCLTPTPVLDYVRCDDGNPCTTQDYCRSGVCQGSADSPLDCHDDDACTDDFCEPGRGCRHVPIADRCGGTGVPSSFLFVRGAPQDGLTDGAAHLFTPADGDLGLVHAYGTNTALVAFNSTAQPAPPLPPVPVTYWQVQFYTPHQLRLTPGAYEHAGPPSSVVDRPGLALGGSGSCNGFGRFDVLEATYDPVGNLLTFAADFEYRCSASSAVVTGAVRIRTGDAVCFAAPDGTPCDDRNACTATSSCRAGACVGDAPVVCAAPDACHAPPLCDPTTGACLDPPAKADGTACDRPERCLAGGTCQGGACVGGATTCDDRNVCTEDACAAGTCTHTPVDGTCWALSGTTDLVLRVAGRTCTCRQRFGPTALALGGDGRFALSPATVLCSPASAAFDQVGTWQPGSHRWTPLVPGNLADVVNACPAADAFQRFRTSVRIAPESARLRGLHVEKRDPGLPDSTYRAVTRFRGAPGTGESSANGVSVHCTRVLDRCFSAFED